MQKIKVIQVTKAQLDLMTATPEEIKRELGLVAEGLPRMRMEIEALEPIVERLQGATRYLRIAPPAGQLPEVTGRWLFTCPVFVPVIGRVRGAVAPDALRVRFHGPARAVDAGGKAAAVAGEEAASLLGVAIDPARFGGMVVDSHGGGVNRGTLSNVTSGTFSAPVLAATAPLYFPQPVFTTEEVGKTLRGLTVYSTPDKAAAVALIIALLRQGRAALAYTEGAGALLALAALAAAADDESVAHAIEQQPSQNGDTPEPLEESKVVRFMLTQLRVESAESPDLYRTAMAPLVELYNAQAFDVYIFVLMEGREAPAFSDFLARGAVDRVRRDAARRDERARSRAAALLGLHLIVVEDKLGAARHAEVYGALLRAAGQRQPRPGAAFPHLQAGGVRDVLALLSKREREIVTTELENRRAEWEAQLKNKCPHVRLARRLRSAPTLAQADDTLKELSAYFAGFAPSASRRSAAARPPQVSRGGREARSADAASGGEPPDDWIYCKNCGFRVVCPHVRERIRLEARGAAYDEVRTRLARFALRYQRRGGDEHTYFCRICSERLSEFIDGDELAAADQLGRYGSLDAGLRGVVWGEAMRAAPAVRFPTPTDPRRFAGAAADVIYPIAAAAEESAAKKTRRRAEPVDDEDLDEVDPRTRLHVVLFVYAYVLDLIQRTEGGAARGEGYGFEGVRPGAKASAYADRILTHVGEVYRWLLAQVEEATPDYLAARFKEAFRLVRGEGGDLRVKPLDAEVELIEQMIPLDPIWFYAAAAARAMGPLTPGLAATPAAQRREFEAVMGDTLPGIVAKARKSAKEPGLAPFMAKRAVIEVPPDSALEFLLKNPRISLYADLFAPRKDSGASAADVEALYSSAITGGAARDPAAPRAEAPPLAAAERGYHTESYRLFHEYTTAVTSREAWAKWQEKFKRLRAAEAGFLAARADATRLTAFVFADKQSRQYTDQDTSLSQLYDEYGEAHEWTLLLFAGAGGKKAEIKVNPKDSKDAAVTKAILSGEVTGMSPVDSKCGVCGVLRSEAPKAFDAAKVQQAMFVAEQFAAFYGFYETRCPKGGLHDFAGDKCARCGMLEALSSRPKTRTPRNEEARRYYEKFAPQFDEERRAMAYVSPAEGPAPAAETAAEADGRKAWALGWKFDYTQVVRAAEAAELAPTLLMGIGDMEHKDFADVKEGKAASDKPEHPDDPRILAASSVVRVFLADYGTLQRLIRVSVPPPRIHAIVDRAGLVAAEYGKLQALPDLADGFDGRFGELVARRAPADVLNFCIEKLSRMVLTLTALGGEPPLPAIAKEFAAHELKHLIRSEKMLSAPAFTFSPYAGPEDEEGVDVPDVPGDVGEDTLGALVEKEEKEGADDSNPYSYENMDYDPSEFADDGEDSNEPNPDFDT